MVGREEGAWLDIEAEHRAALILRLTMYRLRAKVEIAADDTPVLAAWPAPSGPGWVADPRLPALGARGYGVDATTTTDQAAYDAHRLALGVPGPATGARTRPIPSRPISTCCTASTSRRAASSARRPPRA